MSRGQNLLAVAARPLELVNAVAYALYRRGVLQVERAGVPVISVGNIAAGGTGKTPVVAALARELLAAGCRPAVLTRGYRRREHEPILIWRDADVGWERAGDEPTSLARALPEVPIVVDPVRSRGARRAVAETNATHLILDDGFQHWRLARDLDLVVVDAADPLCEHAPRREHPHALARASAVLLSGCQGEAQRAAAAAKLDMLPSGTPVIPLAAVPRALHDGGQTLPPGTLTGRRVLAVAGIANPHRFARTLESLGAAVVSTSYFADHHAYSPAERQALIERARTGELLLVTTAKDAVKLPGVAWLEIEAVAPPGALADLLQPLLAGIQSRP